MRRMVIAGTAVGVLAGAAAGIALLIPAIANAQQVVVPTAATASAAPGQPGQPENGAAPDGPRRGAHELVTDTSVAAKAIGISEADLVAALGKGQTIAQVAQSKGVNPQAVIDALVADGKAELADQVKNGQLTQAQADSEQAAVVQRATGQVNGTFGKGGPGGHGRPNDNDADDATPSPSTTS